MDATPEDLVLQLAAKEKVISRVKSERKLVVRHLKDALAKVKELESTIAARDESLTQADRKLRSTLEEVHRLSFENTSRTNRVKELMGEVERLQSGSGMGVLGSLVGNWEGTEMQRLKDQMRAMEEELARVLEQNKDVHMKAAEAAQAHAEEAASLREQLDTAVKANAVLEHACKAKAEALADTLTAKNTAEGHIAGVEAAMAEMKAKMDERHAQAATSDAALQQQLAAARRRLAVNLPFDDGAVEDYHWLNLRRHRDQQRVSIARTVACCKEACSRLHASLERHSRAVVGREHAWLHHPSSGLGKADGDTPIQDLVALLDGRQRASDARVAALGRQVSAADATLNAMKQLSADGTPPALEFPTSPTPTWPQFVSAVEAAPSALPATHPTPPTVASASATAATIPRLLTAFAALFTATAEDCDTHAAVLRDPQEVDAVAGGDGPAAAPTAALLHILQAASSSLCDGATKAASLAAARPPPSLHTALTALLPTLKSWASAASNATGCMSQRLAAVHGSTFSFPSLAMADQEAQSAGEAVTLSIAAACQALSDAAFASRPEDTPPEDTPACVEAGTHPLTAVPRALAPCAAVGRGPQRGVLQSTAQGFMAWVNGLPLAPPLSHASALQLETAARRAGAHADRLGGVVEGLQGRLAEVTLQRDNALIEVGDTREAMAEVAARQSSMVASATQTDTWGGVDATTQTTSVVRSASAGSPVGGDDLTAGGGTGGSGSLADAKTSAPTTTLAAEQTKLLHTQRQQLKTVCTQLKTAAQGYRKELAVTRRSYQEQLEVLSTRASMLESLELFCVECGNWNVVGQLATQGCRLPKCAHGDHEAGLRR